MKKLILILSLLLSTLVTFAQNSQPNYLRARSVSIGFRESVDSPITWTQNAEECSILIECYVTKVVINSQKLQTYHILYPIATEVPHQAAWRCKDLDASTCNLKMTNDPEYPGLIAVEIEYNDAVWFYICTKD